MMDKFAPIILGTMIATAAPFLSISAYSAPVTDEPNDHPVFSSEGEATITPLDARKCFQDKTQCLPHVKNLPAYKELSRAGISKDRWDSQDKSMLEGCWILGEEYNGVYGTSGSPERAKTIVSAERYCFDNTMHGSKEFQIKLISGPNAGVIKRCTVPVEGRFNSSGDLVFYNKREACEEGAWKAFESTMTCTRDDNGTATCNGTNHGLDQENIWFRKDYR